MPKHEALDNRKSNSICMFEIKFKKDIKEEKNVFKNLTNDKNLFSSNEDEGAIISLGKDKKGFRLLLKTSDININKSKVKV